MKQTTARLFLLALMILASVNLSAQTTTLTGVLVSESSGEGEPFATVRVFAAGTDKNPLAMFVTDVYGRFSHAVKGSGQADVVFSSLGKEDLRKTVSLKGGTLKLDTLLIRDSATAIECVEIMAMKPLVKMETDKMSYNVADDNDSKSSTVLDMLRKVPMVSVDGQDNITVNGSSSFKVYVDGKPNVMFSSNPSMVFKSMPASMVKNIEVVTNPGAKYDAEGAGGVLNIVLNKQGMGGDASMNGYNGTVEATVGNANWNLSTFLSGQQGRLSYSGNLLYNKTTPRTVTVESVRDQGGIRQLATTRTKTRVPFTMAELSLGYELDSMSTLGFTAELTDVTMRNSGTTNTSMTFATGHPVTQYATEMFMKQRQTSITTSLDYQRFFNRDRTQWIAVAYQLSHSPSKNVTDNNFEENVNAGVVDLTDRRSENREKTTEHTLQADYTQPVGTPTEALKMTLNTGAKLMMRRASSEAATDFFAGVNPVAPLPTDYLYKNTIGAAYAEYEAQMGSFGAKGGLRYEHTWQDVVYRNHAQPDFGTDYGNLVPSASISYSLAPTVNLGLTYNMRLSRPGITYLNPYVDQSDPTALTYGNTNLDAEKAHNTSIVFNAYSMKLMLNLNVHDNFTDNAIEQYSFNQGNKLHTTYGNIVRRHTTGFNGYVNWMIHKNTRLFLNGRLDYVDMRSSALGEHNSGWQGNALVGVQQTLPWELKSSLYMMTSTKSYTLQGWSSGFNMLMANVSKSLLKDKLTLTLTGLTGLGHGGSLAMDTYSRSNDFENRMNIRVPIYGVTFSLQYSFGNSSKQFKQHQSRIQNDYIEQKSKGETLQGVGSASM